MKVKNWISAAAIATLSWSAITPVYAEMSSEALLANARTATSENPVDSAAAIANLRKLGQEGIQAFLATYKSELRLANNPNWQQLNSALDAICQQRDCYATQLYWHTDLEQAKAEAKATGKPILSLRLLGRLDEDLSCANSRFFRVALYPNAEISQTLRDRFVLHWQSVRPVPKITIDFGDGRKLERTVTGNSIHYILNSDGHPVDALPGMYGPQAFLQHLLQAEGVVKEAAKLPVAEQDNFIRKYHRDRLATIQAKWVGDLQKLGIAAPEGLKPIPTKFPTAQEAGARAISKMYVENPLVSAISINQQALSNVTNDESWNKIAQLHASEARLDGNSLVAMRRKNPQVFNISQRGITPGSPEDPLVPVVNRFESLMAMDTVRNEYLLQPQIYQWLIESPINNLEAFNEQVYSQLFLTPSTDPWLGLLPADGYTAIQNEGVKQ
jgi:hypothetical protein